MTSKNGLAIIFSFIFSPYLFAQLLGPQQLFPENGANGIQGVSANSFIIQWDTVPYAAYYEWVISDNHLCFKGCAGDTREGNTISTGAISYNFYPNVWYYWIVRAILTTGDTTASSPIWSFKTTPSAQQQGSFISVYPNPVNGDIINIGIEWVIDPSVQELTYEVIDMYGNIILNSQTIELAHSVFVRQELHPLNVSAFAHGIYFIVFTLDNQQQFTKQITVLK